MWSWFKKGHTAPSEGASHAGGIGQTRLTKNVAAAHVDDAVRISDSVAIEVIYHLLHTEGLSVGLSSAINVTATAKIAREGGPGQVIVTVLCDGGARYASTLYNPAWLAANNPTPRNGDLKFLDLL